MSQISDSPELIEESKSYHEIVQEKPFSSMIEMALIGIVTYFAKNEAGSTSMLSFFSEILRLREAM